MDALSGAGRFLLGLLLAMAISGAAYAAHALSRSGALAAAVLGALVFGLGGWEWAIVLLVFFISSSGLSRLAGASKARLEEKFSKGSRRDAGQVAANGGVAGLFVVLHLTFPGASWPWLGFTAALAAVNADTWATELGVLDRFPPRLITSLRPVERGTSGGVSLAGCLAALGGALLVALAGVIFWPGQAALQLSPGINQPLGLSHGLAFTLLIGLAGLAGSLVDSLLGATLQAIYFCPSCGKETERHPLHTCGATTRPLRGLPWLNNDWVNAFCALSGTLVALVLYLLI